MNNNNSDEYFINGFAIRPHKNAPIYSNQESAKKFFAQILEELKSPNFSPNAEAINILRQTSLVSLWFFLSLLSLYEPYDKLNDSLSIDMCNFRQSIKSMSDGATSAAFMPRGFFKTSVFSHGADKWELLRNPDETIVIVNAIVGKALEFVGLVNITFTTNEIMQELFPEYIVSRKNGGQATTERLVLPNRARFHTEPSIRALGVTGAAEGGHFSLQNWDDLVGLDSVDKHKMSTALMDTVKKWIAVNQTALRLNAKSRIVLSATRYGIDDCYADVYSSCKSVTGWKNGDLQPTEGGQWDVYYRLVEENGTFLRPDIIDRKELTRLLIKDQWAAMAQYYNSPEKSGLSEFIDSHVGICHLKYDENKHGFWIVREIDRNFDDGSPSAVLLDDCYVILSTDLAATYEGINAKTCRSSIAVWATDSSDNKYRIWSRVGYFSIFQSMDYIFEAHQTFNGVISGSIIESNAFQKIVKPILDKEQHIRNVWINPIPVMAKGDKKARIRSCLGMYLSRGKIYTTLEAGKEFLEELRIFPMSDTKVDVLDESEKGITFSQRPLSTEEKEFIEDAEEEQTQGALSCFGY